MKNFFSYVRKNWATTALGLGTLASVGFSGYANPAILANPGTISAILTGFGMIVAPDPATVLALQQGVATNAAAAAPDTQAK
jgi:hypothetical protein